MIEIRANTLDDWSLMVDDWIMMGWVLFHSDPFGSVTFLWIEILEEMSFRLSGESER